MLDLDKYIENELEVKIFGKKIHVKEITARMMSRINMIEKGMNPGNIGEKRTEVAIVVLNNNRERVVFDEKDFEDIPYVVVDKIAEEVSEMKKRVEEAPNSNFPSQTEK